MSKRPKSRKPPVDPWRGLTTAVFVVAFFVRLFFWQATPDRAWPHSAVYKGDAVTWVEWAQAIDSEEEFELGLPIRPPGNAYLLSFLGVTGPETVPRGKLIWCLLGALVATLFFIAAHRTFGIRVGLVVAVWTVFSTPLMGLSSALNNETPYMALVAGLVLVAVRLRESPSIMMALAWGAGNGITLLFRVEHLLFFAFVTLWLLWSWRDAVKPSLIRLVWAGAAFVVVLVPWHLGAWAGIERFNTEEPRLEGPAESAQMMIEQATSHLEWTPEAQVERERLPAFVRRSMANFVAATVVVRRGSQVTAESFEILEEAFGYRPEALGGHPLVALYGPLNFYLAHGPNAGPGFHREVLDRPPTLEGGEALYPRMLLAGLPPPELTFSYPPHLEAINHGYRMGSSWIAENPGETLARTWQRLRIFWQGAAGGWTGWGVPFGSTGIRRAVDLVVPTGTLAGLWQIVVLGLCGLGLWHGRRSPELFPWLAILLTKVAATVLFFGYARHGATCVPVLALLAALAVLGPGRDDTELSAERFRQWRVAVVFLAILGVGLELYRTVDPPQVQLDGQGIETGDPHPIRDHQDRRFTTAREASG